MSRSREFESGPADKWPVRYLPWLVPALGCRSFSLLPQTKREMQRS